MATVTLKTVWLNDAGDPDDYQSFPFLTSKASTPQQTVDLRAYAAGRRRVITTPGKFSQLALTLSLCTAAQVSWLEGHAGSVVCVRDERGRKFFGVYSSPQGSDHSYNTESDESLTVDEITYSEGV